MGRWIQCGYCPACFPLHSAERLREHVELEHPGMSSDKIPVDIYAETWLSDPPSEEKEIEVLHDLWEAETAWNSLEKNIGL